MNPILNGFSGSFTSTAGIDKVIAAITKYNGNVWRNASNASWVGGGTRPWNISYLDYFLSHCNHYLIIDRSHIYPPGALTDSQWIQAETDTMNVLAIYGSTPANESTKPQNKKVAIEIVNECNQTDSGNSGTTATIYNAHIQKIIDHIRQDGYTNIIVQDNQWQPFVKFNDPHDKTYQGNHFYFNQYESTGPVTKAKSVHTSAINKNITNLVITELGASYNEGSYDSIHMGYLETFLDWAVTKNIGCCIWLNHNTDNLTVYESMGITTPWKPTERNKLSLSGTII